VCTIISLFYDIDKRTLPALSAKKRRIDPTTRSTLCQQSINSISNPPFFLFVNAFAIVLSVLRFIFSSISHHSIQHSSYSPSISFDTNKERTNNLTHTTPANNPAYHTCSFLSLLHANPYLPFHFALKTYIPSTPSSVSTPLVVVELSIPLCMYTRTIVACYIVILEGLSELLRIPFECMKIQLCRTNSVQSSGTFSHKAKFGVSNSELDNPGILTCRQPDIHQCAVNMIIWD